MLRLHDYRPSANGYKVRQLLAQLERPYELVSVDIFAGEARTSRDTSESCRPTRPTPT